MHIGHLIEKELKGQERTVTWFAKQLNCDRTNIYNIFNRVTIDTELLIHISKVLNKDFFLVISEEINRVDGVE